MEINTTKITSIRLWDLFLVFLRLGLTSFGGPVAHLGYFREEFVARKKWLSEQSYADIVALCQFLPGPASSQVGLAVGLSRAGYWGALAAWAGFTLPSAIALTLFALSLGAFEQDVLPGALQGLKIVAVAVVAQAVWGMAKNLCPDARRASLMALCTCVLLLVPSVWTQVAVIVLAGMVGLFLFRPQNETDREPLALNISHRAGLLWFGLFCAGLIFLPLMAGIFPNQSLALIDAFYRAGSLVFGGGHVVLPLLQAEVVPPGWVDANTFLAGYGAAQAVPGPLFTFASFLGASMHSTPNSWLGSAICLFAIFAPSFLLVAGALPFWEKLRHNMRMQAALTGINAAVVGVLLAALYDPVWTSAIHAPQDFALALLAFVALIFWKIPPWLVVLACAACGWGLGLV
ncbi:MAG: chromate efflux transporter [Desulfobulbaceae bacterium]|nr:chromate efflux transporter [Desulfobulbaceae bacterium]